MFWTAPKDKKRRKKAWEDNERKKNENKKLQLR